MTIPVPDPVAEAAAYQASLLAALGDDDPAEVQAGTGAAIRRLLTEAGPDVRTPPEPGEWSVLECLGHLGDGELVVSGRYRWIIAEDTPAIVGYDQALWVAHLRHRDDEPDDLVAQFDALRRGNLALWERFGAPRAVSACTASGPGEPPHVRLAQATIGSISTRRGGRSRPLRRPGQARSAQRVGELASDRRRVLRRAAHPDERGARQDSVHRGDQALEARLVLATSLARTRPAERCDVRAGDRSASRSRCYRRTVAHGARRRSTERAVVASGPRGVRSEARSRCAGLAGGRDVEGGHCVQVLATKRRTRDRPPLEAVDLEVGTRSGPRTQSS
jgi:hypothetical protein